jgi:hypothetical protein
MVSDRQFGELTTAGVAPAATVESLYSIEGFDPGSE